MDDGGGDQRQRVSGGNQASSMKIGMGSALALMAKAAWRQL